MQTYSHIDRFWHQLYTLERTLYSQLSAVVVVVVIFVAAATTARVYAPHHMQVMRMIGETKLRIIIGIIYCEAFFN